MKKQKLGQILGLGQGVHKMSLEHPEVPESKEVLKEKQFILKDETCQRNKGTNLRELWWPNLGQFEQQNKKHRIGL